MSGAISFLKTVRNTINYWYLPLVSGIIFIAVGIYVFTTPTESYLALSIIFSWSFLIVGIFESYFAIANREEMDNWGWTLALGLFILIIGIILIMNRELSMVTLPLYVGFLILFRSLAAISLSFELKNYYVMDWGNLLAMGILGTIISFILIWNPLFAGLSIVVWTGLGFIITGFYSIFFSFKLKKIKDLPSSLSKEIKQRYEEVKNEISGELQKNIEATKKDTEK